MKPEEPIENFTSGWIRLYRSVKNKPWYKKSEYVHLWMHLLIRANHKPDSWIYKGQTVEVNRGQFITSRKTLSEETGINESKIERILKYFEIEQQIEQQNMFTSRLISIVSYEHYQNNEQVNEQQANSKRTASEQQVNTNKESKNVNNVKKREAFSKPSLEDLKNYFKEIGLTESNIGEKFIAHYDSKGWKVGKEPMKDWKAACRTWHIRWKEKNQTSSQEEGPIFKRIHPDSNG